jgi:cardiolipin synthase (CMP-forming)
VSPDKDRILTIPNLVTFIRLIGVGVFWWLLLNDRIVAAAWFIFAIGWTDWVDGYLARKLNQVSRLGAALDPIADRLLIFSAVVGGLIAGVVPFWIGILLIAREVLMGIVAITLAVRGHGVLEVRYLGKLATFILLGAIPSFYLASAGVLPGLMSFLGWTAGVIGLALYWYVAFQYLVEARSRMGGVKSTDPQERDE